MKKTYAVSDLHGYFNLYEQIKNFIQPEDKVIFLGDATDRGPQSLELAKTIYADPQFTYLKGNHEDMLVKTALDFYDELSDRARSYEGVETEYNRLYTAQQSIDVKDGTDLFDINIIHKGTNYECC